MWHCAAGSNNTKRSFRIMIVISVTLCIIVIYVNRSNTLSSFNDMYSAPRNLNSSVISYNTASYSDAKHEAVDRNLSSTSLNAADAARTELGANKRNIFQTLLQSKPEMTKTYMTDTTEVDQRTNSTNNYSVQEITTPEVPLREQQTYIELFHSQKSENRSVINWNKFQKRPFRQKTRSIAQKAQVQMSLIRPYFQTFEKDVYDIKKIKAITFDPAFKNPCWRGKESSESLKDGNLHCLPYFYLMGVKKSGTTEFYRKISSHPDYCEPLFAKESQWTARLRFGMAARFLGRKHIYSTLQKGIDPRKVEFFVSLFDNAARCISLHPSTSVRDPVHYKMITGEASPSTFHLHTNWERLPGNENLTEPRYTNFHYVKRITPNAKIITLFRDPTTRLYSDYLHSTRGKHGKDSPRLFHGNVVELVKAYKRCFSHFSQRSCVYNNTLKKDLKEKGIEIAESFNAGFYAVLMRDMLAVFGKSQLLPILMIDYVTNMEETLRKAFSFLDMSAVDTERMQRILQLRTGRTSLLIKKKAGPMLNKTRDMLYHFYRPYNEDMSALMNDTRYLFLKT